MPRCGARAHPHALEVRGGNIPANISNTWTAWTAAALTTSLIHVLIDLHIGLYGETSLQMTPLQAANLFVTSLVYGWWMHTVAVASSGDCSALLSALAVTVLWAFLWNGLKGFIVSPPPSSAFPYQDLAHILSLVFGAAAGVATWGAVRSGGSAMSWTLPVVTGVVLLSAFVVQSVLGLRNAG